MTRAIKFKKLYYFATDVTMTVRYNVMGLNC